MIRDLLLNNPATLLAAAASVLAVTLLAGVVSGGLSGRVARAPEQDTPAVTTAATRDTALALRVLGTGNHWGAYTSGQPRAGDAPEKGADEDAKAARAAGVSGDQVQRSFVLVGIESRSGQRHALLQYRDKAPLSAAELVRAPDANGIVRLGYGESLAKDIAVASVERDHLRLTTPGGETILRLYETTP